MEKLLDRVRALPNVNWSHIAVTLSALHETSPGQVRLDAFEARLRERPLAGVGMQEVAPVDAPAA